MFEGICTITTWTSVSYTDVPYSVLLKYVSAMENRIRTFRGNVVSRFSRVDISWVLGPTDGKQRLLKPQNSQTWLSCEHFLSSRLEGDKSRGPIFGLAQVKSG